MDLMGIERLLESLNEYQRNAVNVGPGRAAVIGNPAAGKTRVLTARLARLARDGFDLQWCLAMTFTRFASREINERLVALGLPLGRVGTIHSVCNEILSGPGLALCESLSIDESGWKTQMLLKRVLSVDRYKRYRYSLEDVEGFVSAVKSTGIAPVFGNPFGTNYEAAQRVEQLASKWSNKTGLPDWALPQVYDELEAMRAASHLYSYDDMQLWAWMLMLRRPDVLTWLHQRWTLVMVDESQDSNPIQWDMTYLLAHMGSTLTEMVEPGPKDQQNLMALGDVSQSLYGWRSATPEWFQEFARSDDTGLFVLPLNYRSVPEICRFGSSLVRGEEFHLGGKMEWGGREAPPALGLEPVRVQRFDASGDEAGWILRQAASIRGKLGSWRSVAVLARLSAFLNFLEIECIRRGIPYEKRCGGTFAGGREVTGLVGYLRVAGGWDPSGKWERQIINMPFRFIGKQALYAADAAHDGGPGYIWTLLNKGGLSLRQRRSIEELDQTLRVVRAKMDKGAAPAELLRTVMALTDFEDALRKESGGLSLDTAKLAAIQQVEWLASLFETVDQFVVFMDQLGEGIKQGRKRLSVSGKSGDALVLSTIHQAKGMEWPTVFLADVVAGRHPWNRAHSVEEELRLAYVAVTRAMYHCTVTYSGPEDEPESFIIQKVRNWTSRTGGVTAIEDDERNETPRTEMI